MTEKADRVKELLENQHLKDAFAGIRQKCLDIIETAPVASSEENLTLIMDSKRMLKALDMLKTELETVIRDGKYEDFQANEQNYLGDLNGRKPN